MIFPSILKRNEGLAYSVLRREPHIGAQPNVWDVPQPIVTSMLRGIADSDQLTDRLAREVVWEMSRGEHAELAGMVVATLGPPAVFAILDTLTDTKGKGRKSWLRAVCDEPDAIGPVVDRRAKAGNNHPG